MKMLSKAALVCLGFVAIAGRPALAAIETDPQALYAKMTEAYTQGTARGWTFDEHRYYASIVYATGRAYSLFRHTDPNYAQLAALTVDVASGLHYDQLNSEDSSVWWIREAAVYERDHDPSRADASNDLINRIDESDENYTNAARIADEDATANVVTFHGDSEARVEQVIVDLRAAALTGDQSYKLLALSRAAQPNFPLVRLPSTPQYQIYQLAQDLLDSQSTAAADRANAKAVLDRRNATPELQEIGSVTALRHSFHLSITAPADEYFGRNGMSVLGIHNSFTHLQAYLNAGYGARQAAEGDSLTDALRDLQHTYPRDFELPKLLGQAITLVARIPDDRATRDVRDLRQLLIDNYPESPEALALVAKDHADNADSTANPNATSEESDGTPQAQPAAQSAAVPRAEPDITQEQQHNPKITLPTNLGP